VPRGDPVHGVGIVRNPDAVSSQLVPKSYRPGAGDRRRRFQLRHALGELPRRADQRLPDSLARFGVERREDLAPVAIEDRQSLALGPGLPDPSGDGVERADATRRKVGAEAEPTRGGDPDSQAGERAGTEADRNQVDPLPAPRRRRGALDLLEQGRRVPGPPLGGEPQPRLVQSLAVAPGAGGGVGGRGVEADDDQRDAASSLRP
jgi:hypothetical protein